MIYYFLGEASKFFFSKTAPTSTSHASLYSPFSSSSAAITASAAFPKHFSRNRSADKNESSTPNRYGECRCNVLPPIVKPAIAADGEGFLLDLGLELDLGLNLGRTLRIRAC